MKYFLKATLVLIALTQMVFAQLDLPTTHPSLPEGTIDVRSTARALASEKIVQYLYWANFKTSEGWKTLEGKMNTKFQLTTLSVDGLVILDESQDPLPGLPFPKAQCQYLSFSLDANSEGGKSLAWGASYYENPKKGQAISVVMVPESLTQFIEFDKPKGVNADELRIQATGEKYLWGRYQDGLGVFSVGLSPSYGPIEYEIVNPFTGERYATGTIAPFTKTTPVDNTGAVTVKFDGGVEQVNLDSTGKYDQFVEQRFDGQALFGETSYFAKSFFLNATDEAFTVYYTGTKNAMVMIEEYSPYGEMVLLGTIIPVASEDGSPSTGRQAVSAGDTGVVITVIYTGQNVEHEVFNLSFNLGVGTKG